MFKETVFLKSVWICISIVGSQFFECHDDPSFMPKDGPVDELQFTWLGVLQYVHMKDGTPHYFRSPRVVLITRQFLLSTAVDAAQVPEEYALGNVIFADYERDEHECSVSIEQIAAGMQKCDPAVMLMPIADVLLHPEYKNFGAKNSLALLKLLTPVRSEYVLPACVPFKNHLTAKSPPPLYHIDFQSDVPRDFIDEEKSLTRINLLPSEICFMYDPAENSTSLPKDRLACSTGCGFHSGAPSLVHEHTGHWSIVAIAEGGSPCPDPLRARRPPAPPRHLLISAYVPWITAAITGNAVGAFAKDDPFGFTMPRASLHDTIGHAWVGHWWMGGLRCYDRGVAAEDLYRFYHEVFQVTPADEVFMSYNLEIHSARDSMIMCVKVGMPFRIAKPRVWNIGTASVKVSISILHFFKRYKFQVEGWAVNTTSDEGSESQ